MRALRYDLFTILTVSESYGRHINIYKLKCLRSQRNVGFGGDCGQLENKWLTEWRQLITSSAVAGSWAQYGQVFF